MNNKQKALTYVAVAAILLIPLFVPWDLIGSIHNSNVTRYAPIFAPPALDTWAKRELASSVFWSWLLIGIIYSLLFVAFRDRITDSQKETQESPSTP